MEQIHSLQEAGTSVGFDAELYGHIGEWPLLSLHRRAATPAAKTLYISSGIHGDEQAGPQAILELFLEDGLPDRFNYWICPILNPDGLNAGTRENANGIDLNRDYRDPISEEIRLHIEWINKRIDRVDIAFHLHEDWESKGYYLYELNFSGKKSHSKQILESVSTHLPIETAGEIDGRPSVNGIICPETMPEIEEGHPEAIYFQNRFGGVQYTLETPSSLPLRQRVEAHKTAILSVANDQAAVT